MSDENRPLGALERKLTRALLLVSLATSLTWFGLFFNSGHWVRSDGQAFLAMTLLVGGMLWAVFAFVAFLMLLFGVGKR